MTATSQYIQRGARPPPVSTVLSAVSASEPFG